MKEIERFPVGEITVIVCAAEGDYDYALVDWTGEVIEPPWRAVSREKPWTLEEARAAGIEHAQRLAGPELCVYRTESRAWTGVLLDRGIEVGRIGGCSSPEEVETAAVETWCDGPER
jgi:hypothetical protein